MAATETAVIKQKCKVCGVVKWTTEYYKKSGSVCKECANRRSRKYRVKHQNELNEYSRIYHHKPENKKRMRDQKLKKDYGITLEEYNVVFVKQNGMCAICGKHQSEVSKALAVDHCHNTGLTRGLLCSSCNTGIGLLGDDIKILKKAIRYLGDNNGSE